MTEWGMLLLCAYIALGATDRLTRRQVGGAAVALTVIVISVAMVMYSTSTPVDKYIPYTDAPVYGSGVAPNWGLGVSANSENVAGAKAANWFTTDHSPLAADAGSGGGGG